MRIAIVSDIHSNLQALEQALRVINRLRVDEIHCLGDIVGYGGSPNECVNLIRKYCTKVVRGNHDLATVDLSHSAFHPDEAKVVNSWTLRTLTDDNRRYLAWLPFKQTENDYTLVHAGPKSPTDWEHLHSLKAVAEQFRHFSTPVCFIGHTHIPFVLGEDLWSNTFTGKMKFLINVGSVGQPRDRNPRLSFGIFDNEAWTYENVRSDYDIGGAIDAITRARLPSTVGRRLLKGE